MGFRYRKSINLGGGFRINLSKTGVGYSWGVKGYRVTKTAKGNTRRTLSIPGTGISHIEETSKKKDQGKNRQPLNLPIDNNHYDTEEITNNSAPTIVSEGLEELLAVATRTLRVNRIVNMGLCVLLGLSFINPLFILLFCVFLGSKMYVRKFGLVDLEYTIDDDQQEVVLKRIQPMIKITKSNKLWRIVQTSKVIDKKYSGGAESSVKRIPSQGIPKAIFPFKSNIPAASFKTGKEILIFLPDKLFIIQGSKIGALHYTDISTKAYTTRFIESEGVPKDTQVVDKTWRYVNKSGGPDKRFKDNKQLPICLYGEIELKSVYGLNTIIMFSNPNYV